MALTPKQEGFKQALIAGIGSSDAYRKFYNCSGMKPASIYQEAWKLTNHPEIAQSVTEARQAVVSDLVVEGKWTAEKLADEAEQNLAGAREDHAWAPANKALELIGRFTGNLEPAAASHDVRITKVTVVLNTGKEPEGEIVDAEEYTVE